MTEDSGLPPLPPGYTMEQMQQMMSWFQMVAPQVQRLQTVAPQPVVHPLSTGPPHPDVPTEGAVDPYQAPQRFASLPDTGAPGGASGLPATGQARQQPTPTLVVHDHNGSNSDANARHRGFTRPPPVLSNPNRATNRGEGDSFFAPAASPDVMVNPPPAYTHGPDYARHSFAAAVGINASPPIGIPRMGDPFSNGFGCSASALRAHRSASTSSNAAIPSRSGGRRKTVQNRGSLEFDDSNEKMKKVSKNAENEFILLPSSVPIYNGLSVLSQEPDLLEQELEYLRREGLIKPIHFYDKITGPRIGTNFRKAFGGDLLPGDFDCAKSVNGRRLNNSCVKNIKEFTGFNSLFNFFQGCDYCYVVPPGWRTYLDDDDDIRKGQEQWWSDYSDFRERIRAVWRRKAAGTRDKDRTKRNRGKGKGRLQAHDSDDRDSEPEIDDALDAICCEQCEGLFELSDLGSHNCRPRKKALTQSGSSNLSNSVAIGEEADILASFVSTPSIPGDSEDLNTEEEDRQMYERIWGVQALQPLTTTSGPQKRKSQSFSSRHQKRRKEEHLSLAEAKGADSDCQEVDPTEIIPPAVAPRTNRCTRDAKSNQAPAVKKNQPSPPLVKGASKKAGKATPNAAQRFVSPSDAQEASRTEAVKPIDVDAARHRGREALDQRPDSMPDSPRPPVARLPPRMKSQHPPAIVEPLSFEDRQELTARIVAYLETMPYASRYFKDAFGVFHRSCLSRNPEDIPAYEAALANAHTAAASNEASSTQPTSLSVIATPAAAACVPLAQDYPTTSEQVELISPLSSLCSADIQALMDHVPTTSATVLGPEGGSSVNGSSYGALGQNSADPSLTEPPKITDGKEGVDDLPEPRSTAVRSNEASAIQTTHALRARPRRTTRSSSKCLPQTS